MIAIDLFSGAGGMSLGAKMAGIDVKIAVDSDRHASETYNHNHPKTKIISKDIRTLRRSDIDCNGHTQLLFGGPPCQGFSTSNQRTRNLNNRDNWLFLEFIRIVNVEKPDWIVFENVKGLSETSKGTFLKQILHEFHCRGYSTTKWILNAKDYGIPQQRSRLFIIGSKHGIVLKKPDKLKSKPVSVYQAISDLPDLPNGASESWMAYKSSAKSEYARSLRSKKKKSPNHLVTRSSKIVIDRYKCVPQGGNWEQIPGELMSNYKNHRRCHTGIYRRLSLDKPSVVIGNFRKNMLIHPIQNRGLSVREAARLQSFPDWYEFKGSIGFQQQQVGNAVPPLLAKAVFTAIADSRK